MNFRESSLILYDHKLIDFNIGSPVSVEFDFIRLREFKNKIMSTSNIFNLSKLEFVHVHPRGMLDLSLLDINCIEGLSLALGYWFYFTIIDFVSDDIFDIQYEYSSFMVHEDKKNRIRTSQLYIDRNEEHLRLLKLLSYGGSYETRSGKI